MGDGVPNPIGGFGGAKLVEDEDLGVEDGGEDLELGGGDLAVIAVLHLLEEVAVVVEEAGCAALCDEGLEDADGEVGLADADGAGDQQAGAGGLEGIAVDELAGAEVRGGKAAVGGWELGLVVIERAMLVAAGDVGLGDAAGGSALDAAVAGLGVLVAVLLDDAQPGAFALGADLDVGG